MKIIVRSLLLAILPLAAFAAEPPLWLRHSAVSPDGKTVAFNYMGDIYTVPAEGGEAKALTTNPAYDFGAVWSADSQTIAFASDREGGFDVFIVPARGGRPTRLTSHSAAEFPVAFAGNDTVLFTINIMRDAEADLYPARNNSQIYSVNTDGSRPVLFSSIPMADISVNGERYLYHDVKGFENDYRKHHTSSVARDIWLYEDGTYTRLTDFEGEDRTPVWSPDGQSFYYLSERDGTFNVWKMSLTGGEQQQLTYFKDNPVRNLSVSDDALIVFSQNGELYTMREGGEPRKIKIEIVTDNYENEVQTRFFTTGATDMALSPSGKEIAFIVHGEVYVTAIDYITTKRVTSTPEQERNIEFSPDGRSLLYSSERNGVWNIYESTIVRDGEKLFTYATDIKERQITDSGKATYNAKYSPDGKSIAYLDDRTELVVMDLATKKKRVLLEGKYNSSYVDNDVDFEWSPDGKHILTSSIGIGGWNKADVVVIDVSDGTVINLTDSGYSDGNPKWALGGKAVIWASDRAGYRSHGSWGATSDVYIKFLDGEAYDLFRMTKEERELYKEQLKEEKTKEEAKAEEPVPKKSKKKIKEEEKPKEPALDFDEHRHRVMRLTINSSSLSDFALSEDGEKLYYLASFEGEPDLWVRDFKEGSTKILIKGAGRGGMRFDKEGHNLYILASGKITRIPVDSAAMASRSLSSPALVPVTFNARFDYRPAEERQYIFDHIWNLIKDKFYDPGLHGVDWEAYRANYARFLPYIDNNYDFTEMLSEMLGELNASHTGAYYYPSSKVLQTAAFGAFFDNSYTADGLKIEEIIAGSPLKKAGSHVKNGDILIKIEGDTIREGKDYYRMLEGKAGKNIELTFRDPKGKEYTERIKPITYGEQNELLYRRWLERRQEIVDSLSGGRIGYVHIRSMGSDSFREVYSDLLGRYRNCEAVVVDTRYNGGGWLHDDLITLLGGVEYQRFEPRGQYVGSDPIGKWTKPSIVVQSESNYSNAHGFPWLYREMGLGKLVGTQVPGTMTAVWWEPQIDGTIVFGIPQIGVKDMRGNYLENLNLEPDIKVYNTPEKVLQGKDEQLEAAVRELLKELDK